MPYFEASSPLYNGNPSSPSTPTASGTNSVAIGSGSHAVADNSFAFGDQSISRQGIFLLFVVVR